MYVGMWFYIYMYVCIWHIYVYDISPSWLQLLKEDLYLLHWQFLNFHSDWLRGGHRPRHHIFILAVKYFTTVTEQFTSQEHYTLTGLNNQIYIFSVFKYFLSTSFMQHYSESWLGPKRRSLYFKNSSIKIPRISSDTKMILTALKKKKEALPRGK